MSNSILAEDVDTLGTSLDTARVAHDLNNFLAAVLGATEIIAERAHLDADTRGDLANIRASTLAAASLARRLFAGGPTETVTPDIPVDSALRAIADTLRYTLPNGVTLDLALAAGEAPVRVPAIALQRIVMNLATNAAKAMPRGGVLTLRSARVTTPVLRSWRGGAIPRGTYVQIDVCDTGCGIAADVLPRVFDAFFTTRRGQGGHGLGLAAVDTLVGQAGGHIAIDSQVNQGTRIGLFFPTQPDATPVAPPEFGTVLLVDDDDIILRNSARALRQFGWQVIPASSAEEAMELLAQAPPQQLAAVVTDLALPGRSGATLVATLRETLARPDLPAIVMSGHSTQRTRHEIADANTGEAGLRILAKPCGSRDLAAALKDLTSPR